MFGSGRGRAERYAPRHDKKSSYVPVLLPDYKASVVLATHSHSRAAAMAAPLGLLSRGRIEFIGLWQAARLGTAINYPPDEDGETFAQNALLKARHYALLLKKPCLAEARGLVVRALCGEPGVRSDDYGYPAALCPSQRAELVWEKMRGVRDRRCALAVSICLAHPDKAEALEWSGSLLGEVALRPPERVRSYRSVFVLPEINRSLDQLLDQEKRRHSAWLAATGALKRDYPKIMRLLGADG